MKNFKLFLVLLLTVPLLGCEELEELLEEEFDVDVSFTRFITVDIQPTSNSEEAVNFAQSATINLTTAPEIDDITDDRTQLKSIKINRIRYFYKDVEGNELAVVSAEFQIPLIVAAPDTYDTPQVNLANADANNTLYLIDGDFTNINDVLNNLTGFSRIELEYVGSVSDNPIEFTVDVTVDATLTAQIQI
ncbi:MAG: hypothetical protein ACR2MT_02885 [Aurantibacter sp.]